MSARRPLSHTPHRTVTHTRTVRVSPACNHDPNPPTEDAAIATATAPARTTPSAARRLSLKRLFAINAFWFGNGAHWQPLFIALVPEGAKLIVGNHASDLLVGRATAAGGVFALLVPLLAGWLSDRTRTRWGRRRPWMVAGTVLNVVGLGLLALAWSPALLIVFYVAVQAGNNVAGAAYSGVIPDVVPEQQRGQASGLLGTMNQAGTIVGLLLITIVFAVFGSNRTALLVGYAIVAAVLVVSLIVSLPAIEEPILPPLPRAPRARPSTAAVLCAASTGVLVVAVLLLLTSPLGPASAVALATATALGAVGTVASGARIPALRSYFTAFSHRDFLWTFITRCLMQFGIFSIVPFMDSYFQDVVGASNHAAASSIWLLAVIGGGIAPAIIGGIYSDRWGRRKVFVYASSAIQAVAAAVVLFALVRSTIPLYALGLLFGVGYGLYYAIDWALACDVLPDRENATGRDMALWHVSLTLPQVIAPAIAGLLLTWLNDPHHHVLGIATGHNLGFRIVFGSAALWFAPGDGDGQPDPGSALMGATPRTLGLTDLPIQARATLEFRLAWRLLRGVGRSLFHVEVRGLENLDRDGHHVVIANHLQWIDALVVVAGLPPAPRVHVLGDLRGVPGWALRIIRRIGGVIPIDREQGGGPEVQARVRDCLDAGASFLIFPEGRCNEREGDVGPFRKGFAHFALQSGTPVLPIALSGTRELWLRKRITMVVGAPIDLDGHTPETLTASARAAVARLLPPVVERGGPRLLRHRLTTLF